MSERLAAMSDADLAEVLSGLELDWPPAPDLVPTVMAATRAVRRPRVVRLPLSRSKRILLIAAATVLLLAGAAVAARIVIDLGGVVVNVGPSRPGILPPPSAAPTGSAITVEEASALLGHEASYPVGLGPPDRVWADHTITEGGEVVRITMAWRPGPNLPEIPATSYGAVLMRFEGDTDQASKDLSEGTGVLEPVRIDGIEGYWTTGTHLLQLLTSEGIVYVRVDGNVVLWRDGSDTLRLETTLGRSEAVRLAASVGTP